MIYLLNEMSLYVTDLRVDLYLLHSVHVFRVQIKYTLATFNGETQLLQNLARSDQHFRC